MKLSVNDIVLKVLGLLLLVAAVLKGWQLLTEPVANADIWSNRYFLIFTVEFEIAIGIWLLSGLFKKAAWLIGLLCFVVFSCITLYKGITGADSCGCFGTVKVNPWVTLLAIDLPAVVLLTIFRPKNFDMRSITKPVELLKPLPSLPYFAGVCIIGLIAIAISTPALALNEPVTITSSYEVLEPEKWVGNPLPIIDHINIAGQLKQGNWLVLFYHYDCPNCIKVIKELEQITQRTESCKENVRICLIQMPPYGKRTDGFLGTENVCSEGQLNSAKKWFCETPQLILLQNSLCVRVFDDSNIEIFSD